VISVCCYTARVPVWAEQIRCLGARPGCAMLSEVTGRLPCRSSLCAILRYYHSRELASWAEQQEVIHPSHPITPPHSSRYLSSRTDRGCTRKCSWCCQWTDCVHSNVPEFESGTLLCLNHEKNMSCTSGRTCLGLNLWGFILILFLADKTNKQTVSKTYIIYSIMYVVLRDYLFHYFDFLWTQQIKRMLISSVGPSDCFFRTSDQGAIIILTSVCITGNENRNLRFSEHFEFPYPTRYCLGARYWWLSSSRHCATGRKVAGSIPHSNFSLSYSFRPHCGPGVDLFSKRNEYQEYFLGVKAAGAWGWQGYHFLVPIVLKSGSLNILGTWGPLQTCNGIALFLQDIGS